MGGNIWCLHNYTMSTYHRPLPVQQKGSLELDQDDASRGYHAPMEQLSISDEATDGLYGSRNPPHIKRKPLLHLKSTSSADLDESMMMEHASQISSRNLLRKAKLFCRQVSITGYLRFSQSHSAFRPSSLLPSSSLSITTNPWHPGHFVFPSIPWCQFLELHQEQHWHSL